MRRVTARFFEADKASQQRAGWDFHREGDKLPALERAHLAKNASDAQIREHAEFEYGSSILLEVIR